MTTKLNASSLTLSENVRANWVVIMPEGATLEDALKPIFWAHVAKQLHIDDAIWVRGWDRTWAAHLLVLDRADLMAKVAVLHKYDFAKVEGAVPLPEPVQSIYRYAFTPAAGWRVIRIEDGEVMFKGSKTKDEATLWITNALRKFAA